MSSFEDDSSVSSLESWVVNPHEYHETCFKNGRDGWSHAFTRQEDEKEQLTAIVDPKRSVVELFKKENWQRMGEDISSFTALERIDLCSCWLRT